jgi:hypothetical protein
MGELLMIRKLLGLATVLLVSLGTAAAQVASGQGAIAGLVQDPTKAAISGAQVVLSNPSIGFKQETTTNAEGSYKFSPLRVVGGYTLTVTANGFAAVVVNDFATSVGTVITQNVTLSVGSSTTTVEVQSGGVEQVQTDTSAVSQLIDKTVWQDSPLSVRDSNQFVGLTAGAAGDGGTGRGYAVNGARSGTGNFTLEGFDNNDQGLGGAATSGPSTGGSVTRISPDAIQEYRVISSVPNAEYGRAGGFVTDTVLRSGTTQWHGSLFEYNRIQALAQNNFFSKHSPPILQDHLVRNQFGGSIGGPVYKNKTFFFASVEFQRERSGSPVTFTGITQDFYNFVKSGTYEKWMEGTTLQGPVVGGLDGRGFCPSNFGGATCAGAFADVATTGPVFNSMYAATPYTFPFGTRNLTNAPTDLLLGGTNYLPVNIYGDGNTINTSVFNQNRGTLKIDHTLTSKDQLSFTYVLDLDNDTESTGGGYPGTLGPPEIDYGGAQLFGARWTHTFTANLLNEFRGGYLRHVRNFSAITPQGIAAMASGDSIDTGFGKNPGFPQLFTENQFTYQDAVTFTHKTHTMKAGFTFARTRNGSSFYNDVNGTIFPWGSAGILTDGLNEVDGERLLDGGTTGPVHSTYGTLYYASAAQDPSTGGVPDPYRGYRANEFSAYVQDDWKATAHLTFNYGLRWDYFGPPHNMRALVDSNVFFGTATSLVSSGNPFEPNSPLLIAEQGAAFKCVGYVPCGSGTSGPGYAAAANRSTIWDRDVNNFGPRLGFSYDALGNGKMVVRGGFGIGYDRLYNNVYENIRFNGPHFVDNTAGFGAGASGISEALGKGLVQNPFVGNSLLSGAAAVPRHINQHLKTAYYEQIHFGVESNVWRGYVIEVNYIGTLGRQLVGIMNANTFEGRVACSSAAQKTACTAAGIPTANQSTARPTAAFGNDNFRTNGFSSSYSAGQVSLRRGYSHGFQFAANYSYGHALDQISDVFTTKNGGTGIPTPYFPSHSYGNTDYDVRHLATFTLNYRTQSSTHKLLLGGWGISPILSMQSGTPVFIKNGSSSYDPNKDGTTGVELAYYYGTGNIKNSINHGVSPAGNNSVGSGYIKPNLWKSYTCPASVNGGLWCDVPADRNQLFGPRFYNLDVQVSKHLAFSDRWSLTLQAAFFDVDGHPEFGNPSGDINSTSFGQSTSAVNRQGQLSGRIDF